MDFRLLGEVQLRAGGTLLDVGTPRQQAVLAALAVDAGKTVSAAALIDRVWGDAPPVEARNVLYSHLSRIRRLLGSATASTGVPARIERKSAGYVLEIEPDRIDLHRFTGLVESGKSGTDTERLAVLTEALELWRGPPLAAVPGDWASRVRESWHRRRLDAVIRWGEIKLDLGEFDAVVADFPDLTADYPLAEPLEGLLMRALHGVGRDAEALDRYAVIRQRLADELGTDPGAELRDLHAAILRGRVPAPERRGPAVPAQLPPDVHGFAGRDGELRRLDDMVRTRSTALPIVAVSGTAGVGKTALAVHWAHRIHGEFPGGQLYVNLRGFDPTATPVEPAEAIQGFLDAFDVPRQRRPTTVQAQVGLYRSLLADRRVLVVLDNARDVEQVRPLLPGSPGCLVVVTSRDLLSGLVAAGAHPVAVDLFDHDEAREFLAGRVGPDRVTAEPGAADEIVALCARLPLALTVVAARAATHPRFRLAALVQELRQARGLDEFAGTDPVTDPRAAFSCSYAQLSAPAARLFRLVGLHPGPDLGARAAASLAGVPSARPLLAELARAHLVAEQSPGRFSCHDLLRAYACEQADQTDTPEEKRAATGRVLGHYVHSAGHADRLLDPHRDEPPTLTALPAGVEPERMAGREQALAWFDTERRVLVTALHQSAEFDAEVWELAWATRRFLSHQGHWHDEMVASRAALAAAERLDDPLRQAFAYSYAGCTHVWLDDHEEARTRFAVALRLYEQAGDDVGQADIHYFTSWMLDRQGRAAEALPHAERALTLYRSAGHQTGEAKVLNAIGWFHALAGDYSVALDHCEKALATQTEVGDRLAAGQTWHSLGYVHEHLGDTARAIACYRAAADLFHEFGYRIIEAQVLRSLGETHRAADDAESARAALREAVRILDQFRHPDADEIRAILKGLP